MDKPKHTPGPWEVVYRDDESFMSMALIAPKGLMNPDNVGRLIDEPLEIQGKVIAITHHQLTPMTGYEACENDEEDSNAELMAAAPEMYEALQHALQFIENGTTLGYIQMPDTDSGDAALETPSVIRKALTKAQGSKLELLPIKPHDCQYGDLIVIKEFYSQRSTYSSESLRIYRCLRCEQLWKIRKQWDDGTGSDDIWLKPGESDRRYKFTMEEAAELSNVGGGDS